MAPTDWGDSGRDMFIAGNARNTVPNRYGDADINVDGWTIYDDYAGTTSARAFRSAHDAALQQS
jgi:hypothetical protein